MQLCYEQGFLTRDQVRRWLLVTDGLKNELAARTVADRSMNYLLAGKLIDLFGAKFYRDAKPVSSIRGTQKGIQFLLSAGLIPGASTTVPEETEFYGHDNTVTEIRLVWERLVNKLQWYSEKILRSEIRTEVPDAHAMFFSNKHQEPVSLAIEVELTAKSHERYVAKFKAYADDPKYDNILYFSANANITKLIHNISKGITEKIFVCQKDEFLQHGAATRFSSHSDHFTFNERVNCVTRK